MKANIVKHLKKRPKKIKRRKMQTNKEIGERDEKKKDREEEVEVEDDEEEDR